MNSNFPYYEFIHGKDGTPRPILNKIYTQIARLVRYENDINQTIVRLKSIVLFNS